MSKAVNAEKPIKENKNSFWTFPERLNNIVLSLIVIIVVILSAVVVVFAMPQREYSYFPEEKEIQYADKFNVYFKLYSNYYNNNNTLSKTDNFVVYYKPVDKTKWQPQINRTSIIGYTKDGNIEYLAPRDEVDGYIGSIMQRTISPNHITAGDGFQELHFRIGYNLKTFTDSTPIITDEILTFNEKMLTLDKKEIKMADCDEFRDAAEIFTEFYVKVADETRTSGSGYDRKLRSKITLLSTVRSKYHLDIQVFGIKGDEVYDFCGYYGLSCVDTPSTEMVCTLPTDYSFDYIIAKAIFTDANGTVKTYYYKQPFSVK